MPDIADKAQELEELHRKSALEALKQRKAKSTDECVVCGLLISSERQIATNGTDMCVSCADANEDKRKRYGYV